MNTRNATGARISPPEPLAWTLASVGAPTTYPSAAYITQVLSLFITNQGQIGSCVGNTFEEIMRLIVLMTTGTQEQLSWRWVYAICKALDGYADEGTYPSLAAQVIRNFGVPKASLVPNDISLTHAAFIYNGKLKDKASIIATLGQAAWDDAQTRKAGADLTTNISEAGIKQAINYAKANNGGVAILRQIGEEYWIAANGTHTYAKDQLLPMPAPKKVVSGHEELLYGYVDITPAERADLQAHKITLDSLIAKYPDGTPEDPTRTETVIMWQNHWDKDWCSTQGYGGADGGRAYEFLDIWLPFVKELRVSVAALPPVPVDFRYTFTKTMQKGAKGADVVALQHVLDLEGCYDYNPTDGSPKYTGNYGAVTEAGVKKLQEKYAEAILKPVHLTVGTGNFGVSTMAWVNAKYRIIK